MALIGEVGILQVAIALGISALVGLYSIIYLFSHNPRQPFAEELRYHTFDDKGSIVRFDVDRVNEGDLHLDDILISVVVPA